MVSRIEGPTAVRKKMKPPVIVMVLFAVSVQSTHGTGQYQTKDLKNRYDTIEVIPFEVPPNVDLPLEYRTRMMDDVVKDLRRLNKFKEVLVGPVTTGEPTSTIRLEGTVIQYKHGSRRKRLIAIGLAGDTKIDAHVKFVDKATGKLLLEADVDGQVYTGLLGGSPHGAPTGIGKDVAKIAKKVFF